MIGRMESKVAPSRRRIASTSVTHSSSRTTKNFVTFIPGRPAFSHAFSRTARSAACGSGEATIDSTAVETTVASSFLIVTTEFWDDVDDLDFIDLLDLVDLTDPSPNDADLGSGSCNASAGTLFKSSTGVWYSAEMKRISSDSTLLTFSAIVSASRSSVTLAASKNENPGAIPSTSATIESSPPNDFAVSKSPPLDFFSFSSSSIDFDPFIILRNLVLKLDLTDESSPPSPSSFSSSSRPFTLADVSTQARLKRVPRLAVSIKRCFSAAFLARASLASSGAVRPLRSVISILSAYTPNNCKTVFSPSSSTSNLDAAR
mmetsp:Transcript_15036/g.23297  ORF Transcript_15036/g.23297 Transcript_15036/m.23297 type:complete len:317 (+) Transcript_15036:1452-2402(+)